MAYPAMRANASARRSSHRPSETGMRMNPSTVSTTASTRHVGSGYGNGWPRSSTPTFSDDGCDSDGRDGAVVTVVPVAGTASTNAVRAYHAKVSSGSRAHRLSSATATSVDIVEAV